LEDAVNFMINTRTAWSLSVALDFSLRAADACKGRPAGNAGGRGQRHLINTAAKLAVVVLDCELVANDGSQWTFRSLNNVWPLYDSDTGRLVHHNQHEFDVGCEQKCFRLMSLVSGPRTEVYQRRVPLK
jgi:hypothetical protein